MRRDESIVDSARSPIELNSLAEIPPLFWATLFGASVSCIARKKRKKTRFSMLAVFNIIVGEKSKLRVIIIDVAITGATGSIIAYIFTEPTTARQALAAGLGFTSLVHRYK